MLLFVKTLEAIQTQQSGFAQLFLFFSFFPPAYQSCSGLQQCLLLVNLSSPGFKACLYFWWSMWNKSLCFQLGQAVRNTLSFPTKGNFLLTGLLSGFSQVFPSLQDSTFLLARHWFQSKSIPLIGLRNFLYWSQVRTCVSRLWGSSDQDVFCKSLLWWLSLVEGTQ